MFSFRVVRHEKKPERRLPGRGLNWIGYLSCDQGAAGIADDQQGGAEDPSDGVGQGDSDEARAEGFGDGQVNLAESHKGDQHDDVN